MLVMVAVVSVLMVGPPEAPQKWVGPWFSGPLGNMRTTIFYGPWQCRQTWLDECSAKCGSQGHSSLGCIWIADLKVEVEGLFVRGGSKLAFTQCCCNKPKAVDRKDRRDIWEDGRADYRKGWAKQYGEWPRDESGNWPGHHIDDSPTAVTHCEMYFLFRRQFTR